MKNGFLLVVLYTLSTFCLCQNKDGINYSAKGIFIELIADGKTVSRTPLGKNIILTKDKFFKSYLIYYEDVNNAIQHFKLKYVMTLEDGLMLMQDDYAASYYVSDKLDSHGKLIFIHKEKLNGFVNMLSVEGAKRI